MAEYFLVARRGLGGNKFDLIRNLTINRSSVVIMEFVVVRVAETDMISFQKG